MCVVEKNRISLAYTVLAYRSESGPAAGRQRLIVYAPVYTHICDSHSIGDLLKLAQEYLIFVGDDNSIFGPNECIQLFYICAVTNEIIKA